MSIHNIDNDRPARELPHDDEQAALVTAYALGQLTGDEQRDIAELVAHDPTLQRDVAEARRLASLVSATLGADPLPLAAPQLRGKLQDEADFNAAMQVTLPAKRRTYWVEILTGAALCGCTVALLWPGVQSARESASKAARGNLGPTEQRSVFIDMSGTIDRASGAGDSTPADLSDYAHWSAAQPGEMTQNEFVPQTDFESKAADVDAAGVQVELKEFGEEAAPTSRPGVAAAAGGSGIEGRGPAARGKLTQAYGGH
ncbi:MAG TPA: hypothetical protein VL096_16435, partial [Pirellulaceae bacterium]|nr:hypothetical protein [Pirellulaceae bacterium]